MTQTIPRPTLTISPESAGHVTAALRWLNADEGLEADLALEDVPAAEFDAAITLLSALLERARRHRDARQARRER